MYLPAAGPVPPELQGLRTNGPKDPILGVLFLRRTGRNWDMAADRPPYPPSHPWTNWGLQLERDLAARINHGSEREEEALEGPREKRLSVC